MASLRTRTDSKGLTRYSVLWREPDGTQTSWSTPDEPHARRVLAYLGAMGPLPRGEVIREDDQPADMPTLNEWAKRHIDSLTGLTAGTVADYRKLYDRTYGPLLGTRLVSELTRTLVAGALNSLTRDQRVTRSGGTRPPLSRKSIANAHGLLSAMLSSAIEDGLIAKNPARGLRLPQADHEKAEHRFLTPAEFELLLGKVDAHYQPLVMFLAGTGCRWGEAVALLVGDIDDEARTARITKASKWQASGPRPIGPPKTRKSNRTIALPVGLVTMLAPLLTRPAGERLFRAVQGGEVQHRYFRAKVWLPACEAAGLDEPRPGIHSLRHSHVAWLVAAGVPLPVIQDRLGHEKITTTIDTYGHLSPDLRIQAAKAADVVFVQRELTS